jgi:hypothetical protein
MEWDVRYEMYEIQTEWDVRYEKYNMRCRQSGMLGMRCVRC